MKKTKFNVRLPFFHGFYESIYYNSDTLYDMIDEQELEYWRDRENDDTIDEDDIDIYMDDYKKDVSETYTKIFCNEVNSIMEGLIKSYKFTDLDSPRYYNFETDKPYADITFCPNWRKRMIEYMEENKEWLAKKLKKEWSSRDGFISFMETDFDYWKNEINKNDADERYISSMLGYIILNGKDDDDNEITFRLNEWTAEECSIFEYLYCTKEKDETENNKGLV